LPTRSEREYCSPSEYDSGVSVRASVLATVVE
jgi:hypothetical protein